MMPGRSRRDYDTDILEWSERQATLLRRRAAGELINEADLDWPNIAEEIESVGRSERLALASHIETVIEHLAKLELSPALEPRRRWLETVLRTRSAIRKLIKASPSLLPTLETVIAEEMPTAVQLAIASLATHGETPLRPPEEISYTPEQVLGLWLP